MKKIMLILFSLSLLFLVGCLPIANEINLSFGETNLELEEGKTYRLSPIVAGMDNYQIIYSEYDNTIISVNEAGDIVALKEGVTSIKAKLVGYNITADVVVSVIPSSSSGGGDNIEKDYSIVVDGGFKDYQKGETAQLELKENNKNCSGEVTWFSSSPSIVTVTPSGSITAMGSGTASITAIYGNQMVSVNITVAGNEDVGTDPEIDEPGSDTPGITPIITELIISGDFILDVNGTTQLTVRPDVNLDFEVIWLSENIGVATVDQTGKVTGIAAGTVNIVATLKANPSVYVKYMVLVRDTASSDTSITGITISGATEVLAGSRIKLSHTFTPSGATGDVLYTSENQAIATVDQNGWVIGIAGGTVKITVTLISNRNISDSISVKVISLPELINITGNKTLTIGATSQLTAVVIPSAANQAVSWSSSNTAVATVSNSGLVTAKAAGTAIITVTSVASSQVTAVYTITVAKAPTITISDATASIVKGQTKTLTATVLNLTNTAVSWSSNNIAVATVDANGKVTAVATGTATITATSVANTNLKATCTVTVTAPATPPTPPVTGDALAITQSPTGTIAVGATGYQLYIKDSSGNDVSRLECTFTSSASSVATVSSYGTISALAAGTAKITVTHPSKGSGTITLTIGSSGGTTPPAGTLTISQSPTGTIAVGASGYQLYVTDSSGTSLSRLDCTFSSSNSSVATVSTYGTISALSAGTATITVTHPTKGKGTIVLTVVSSGSGGVVKHAAVFNWIEQYLVSRTFSRYVYTYGNTRKTERTLGSVSYFWPGTNTINNTYYGRYHSPMSKVWYVVIHHTGNNNLGADARMTARYCSTADVSIHYCVDAKSVYSGVKESSVAWHAGDGLRPAGSTYYNSTYGATCITGGGANGIGIEMTQDQGNDLFMTWHRTAKLTADILARYSLPTNRVKQHNHFSGKNCPQELRESGLYTEVFAKMVKAEYQYRTLYNTFTITFTSGNTSIINNYGHVISKPASDTVVSYTIKVSRAGITESKTYKVTVPGTVGAAVSGKRDRSEIVL